MTDEVQDSPAAPSNPSALMYGRIAGIFVGECQKFLREVLSAGKLSGNEKVKDEFLGEFLSIADRFSAQTTKKLATFLKKNSKLGDVRDTPEATLERLIRGRAFEASDSLLIDFVVTCKSGGLGSVIRLGDLSNSRVLEVAQSSARETDPDDAPSRPASGSDTRGAAVVRVFDYTNALDALAHDFLDYAGSKLLGPEADFNLLNEFTENSRHSIQGHVTEVHAYLDGFEAVRKKKWDEMQAAENEAIRSVALQGSQSKARSSNGAASLIFGLLLEFPVFLVVSNGISNTYVLGTSVGIALIGIILIFRGIVKLTGD
jgi:hypothetical protein